MDEPRFVFIAGCGHTGTTLTLGLLGAHSKVFGIRRETQAFRYRTQVDRAKELVLAAAAARPPEAEIVVEKTPRHIHHARRIRSVFPDAKFVVCLRDPLDVVASLTQRYGSADRAIARVARDMCRSLVVLRHHPSFALRYERLIREPEKTLTALCSFLGLEYEPDMLQFWRDGRGWNQVNELDYGGGRKGQDHHIRRNWQIHQPMMPDRIGTHRTELSVGELARARECLGSLPGKVMAY